MDWKSIVNNNMVLRNMSADLFGRSEYSTTPGQFTPYFQYKVGPKQNDYLLYFPKEPFLMRYYNEFFNKLSGLTGSDIYKYIEFHWRAYDDKADFLRFLRYELSDRLKKKLSANYRQKYQTAMEWVLETKAIWQTEHEAGFRQEIEKSVQEILDKKQNATSMDSIAQQVAEKVQEYLNKITDAAEEKLTSAFVKLPSANIELNNRAHEEKLIQFFLLLRDTKAPAHFGKTEQLFKRFADIDIASILHLNFDSYRDKKVPTLQKSIGRLNSQMKPNHPKIKKLSEAMQEFFY
ncbi:hypothetical protein [Niabella beijingensis]|uniref:hypothetical protein n=1 Tax=Niabella beijingensis TaxID=2872700 RepID=UPI001CBDB2BC|nr:hypothetical protein [Niabella beijingensis]MBZ4189367.1 hypothetical protein [Niabella beijingensis]